MCDIESTQLLKEAIEEFNKLGYSEDELKKIANKIAIVPNVNIITVEEMQIALQRAFEKINER